MTLRMWNVDGKPKAKLYRKLKGKSVGKPLSNAKELLEIASRSKFVVITFTKNTNEAFGLPSTPLVLKMAYKGLLDMCPNVTDVIVKDIKTRLRVEQLLNDDVRFAGFPSILDFGDGYAVPYELNQLKSDKYSGGQLEVLKDAEDKHSRGRVRRFGSSVAPSSIHVIEELQKVLLPIIQMNAETKTLASVIDNLQTHLPTIRGKYWRQDRNLEMFYTRSPYDKPTSPCIFVTYATLKTAQYFGGRQKSIPSGDVLKKYYEDRLKEIKDKMDLRKLA
ncbi:hypothetical protein EV361DRAFT_599262 [Lentinula raphanica]|nr:hypothetical protein EV361DRAFT_599262 [Lentinula raphanica]